MANKSRGFYFTILTFFACVIPAWGAQDSTLKLEPILITKSKVHLTKAYSLSSDNLKTSPFNSLIEALVFTPLDLQSRSSGIQSDFSLRASSFQGVLILVDGQRLNDSQTAHHNSDLPFSRL